MTCRRCHLPMTLDGVVQLDAAHAMDADAPQPIVYACRNGHSLRRVDLERRRPTGRGQVRFHKKGMHGICSVCGARGPCPTVDTCRKFLYREYQRVQKAGLRWCPEAMPWYRGAVTAYLPAEVPPSEPLIPHAWWEGYARCYDPAGAEAVA